MVGSVNGLTLNYKKQGQILADHLKIFSVRYWVKNINWVCLGNGSRLAFLLEDIVVVNLK